MAQLGDELVLGSIPHFSLSNLTALAARFHDGLHPHDVFIFTNEGGGAEVPAWPEIPAGLDIISVDVRELLQLRVVQYLCDCQTKTKYCK